MSTRLSHSLSDENRNLQKQIGCMNGIFQIFDRRYFLGGRSNASRHRKKLLPIPAQNEDIQSSASSRTPGKSYKTTAKEKQRVSTESSRTSFSSTTSCSSSFSSLDNNRAAHLETLFNQPDFPATREISRNQPPAAKQLSCQSFGFREMVREKINRQVHGASDKTAHGEEAEGRMFKHVDSPRPTRSIKYEDSTASHESFRVLARLREAHRNAEENGNSPHPAPRLNRRLSYDGIESFDSLKSTIKIRELPRLSLDSRESWARYSASGGRSSDEFKDFQKGNRDYEKSKAGEQEPPSYRRPSPVIARLMGLETLSDSSSAINSPSRLSGVYPTYEPNSSSKSRKNDENGQTWFSGSPRISHGDSDSPCLSLASKLPVETTQRSLQNGRKDFNEPPLRSHEPVTSVPNSYSVYGEIEKRLATLEFTKSGKDLRALKQIIEAMRKSRALLEDKEQSPDAGGSQTISTNGTFDHNGSSGASSRNSQTENTHSARAKSSNSPKANKSPIIIMKPAKNIGKVSNSAPTVPANHTHPEYSKDVGPQRTHTRSLHSHTQSFTEKNTSMRISRSTMSTEEQQSLGAELSAASPRVTSSRLHNKFGLEKKSCSTVPSSDSSRTRKTNNKKIGSCSTEVKLRQKSPTSNQKSTNQSSKSSLCPRDVNRGVASSVNTEDTSNGQFGTSSSNNILQDDGCEQMNLEARLSNSSATKETLLSSEQQSPVSVLDSTFYQDESPSPVKKISYAFEDDENPHSEADSGQVMPVQPQKSAETLCTEIKILKSEIDNLRKQIQLVNFSKKELKGNPENSLGEGMNSQDEYISEILLESGLLRELDHGLSTIQLHSPGNLINPDLFLALERSKAVESFLNGISNSKRNARSEACNKAQRKLVFDAVNEILLDKLVVECSSNQWLTVSNEAGSESRGQQILKQICTEVDELQNSNHRGSLNDNDVSSTDVIWKDLMHPSNYWGDYRKNVAGIVLDVERLIFKDLITEIVTNEAMLRSTRLL